ncbi:MAG TPA: pyridoxamine 5'-phosphate oxidase family protein [Candidatus Limnocylindrales bacterium]|nr:pyridoxamine 5'-phosphate oxidase family protein [Candidatus Limnocylindrales bacterium]
MEPAQIPMDAAAGPALTETVRAFLRQPLFATIATTDGAGAARQAVIWYRLEDDGRILVNSRVSRFWPAHLQRDGRASLAVIGSDGYSWVGIVGHVDDVDVDPARALADIEALAWRYHPDGPDPADLDSYRAHPRITFRIAIDRIHDHLED